jgi:hypothetical protein
MIILTPQQYRGLCEERAEQRRKLSELEIVLYRETDEIFKTVLPKIREKISPKYRLNNYRVYTYMLDSSMRLDFKGPPPLTEIMLSGLKRASGAGIDEENVDRKEVFSMIGDEINFLAQYGIAVDVPYWFFSK